MSNSIFSKDKLEELCTPFVDYMEQCGQEIERRSEEIRLSDNLHEAAVKATDENIAYAAKLGERSKELDAREAQIAERESQNELSRVIKTAAERKAKIVVLEENQAKLVKQLNDAKAEARTAREEKRTLDVAYATLVIETGKLRAEYAAQVLENRKLVECAKKAEAFAARFKGLDEQQAESPVQPPGTFDILAGPKPAPALIGSPTQRFFPIVDHNAPEQPALTDWQPGSNSPRNVNPALRHGAATEPQPMARGILG